MRLWPLKDSISIMYHAMNSIKVYFYPCVCARRRIPSRGTLVLKLDTKACQGTDTEVNYLEHVQAVVTLNSTRRGDTNIYLTSPMGTR